MVPSKPSSAQMLFLLLLAGIAVRFLMGGLFEVEAEIGGDSLYYYEVARSLLEHGAHQSHGVPTAYRVPGYPLFLAAILALAGPHWIILNAIANSFVSVGVAIAAFLLLRRTERPYAFAWPLLIALNPFQAIMDLKVLADALGANLAVLALITLYARRDRLTWKRAAMAGLLAGLAALTKEIFLLLPVAIAFGLLFVRTQPSGAAVRAMAIAVFLACVAVVTVPWALRNEATIGGEPRLSDGTMGINLWVGTWERNGDWFVTGEFPDYAFPPGSDRERIEEALANRIKPGPEGAAADAYLGSVAKDRIRTHPLETAATWIVRVPQMWVGTRSGVARTRLETGSLPWKLKKSALWGLNFGVLILGIAGMLIGLRHLRENIFLYALPGYLAAIHIPFHNTEDRYSLAAVPFLLYFALLAATYLWRFAEERWSRRASAGGG